MGSRSSLGAGTQVCSVGEITELYSHGTCPSQCGYFPSVRCFTNGARNREHKLILPSREQNCRYNWNKAVIFRTSHVKAKARNRAFSGVIFPTKFCDSTAQHPSPGVSMCQADWAAGCPESRENMTSGRERGCFPRHLQQWASKAGALPHAGGPRPVHRGPK